MTFLYAPLPPGTRIRSYDFKTGPSESSYFEGLILQLDDSSSSTPRYIVYCDYCNYIGRAGLQVTVPLTLDINDFPGRLCARENDRAQINLNVELQYLAYLDAVWVFRRQANGWYVFNQAEPDRYFWEFPFVKDETELWQSFTAQVDADFAHHC